MNRLKCNNILQIANWLRETSHKEQLFEEQSSLRKEKLCLLCKPEVCTAGNSCKQSGALLSFAYKSTPLQTEGLHGAVALANRRFAWGRRLRLQGYALQSRALHHCKARIDHSFAMMHRFAYNVSKTNKIVNKTLEAKPPAPWFCSCKRKGNKSDNSKAFAPKVRIPRVQIRDLQHQKSVAVAVSGGQDSIFLLFCLSFLQRQITHRGSVFYKIVWCNHFWQGDSFYTTLHLTKSAQALSFPIVGFMPLHMASSSPFTFDAPLLADTQKKVKRKRVQGGLVCTSANLQFVSKAKLGVGTKGVANRRFARALEAKPPAPWFCSCKRKDNCPMQTFGLQGQNFALLSFYAPTVQTLRVGTKGARALEAFASVQTFGLQGQRKLVKLCPFFCKSKTIANLRFARQLPLQTGGLHGAGGFASKARANLRFATPLVPTPSFASKASCRANRKFAMVLLLQKKGPAKPTPRLVQISDLQHLWYQHQGFALAKERATAVDKQYRAKKFIEVLSEATARNWRHITMERACTFYNSRKCVYGHTLSDRVETVLFNIIRGAGRRGATPLQWKRRHSSFCYNKFYPCLEQVKKNTHLTFL